MLDLLHKRKTLAPTILLLLQLDKFELTEWFEDMLEVIFSDAEMDVTHIESMERGGVTARFAFGVASLAILLGFSQLNNDGDAEKRLACELDGRRHRLLVFEFDVTDTGWILVKRSMRANDLAENSPLRSPANSILDDLRFFYWANFFEEGHQLLGPQARSKLLHEDGSLVSLILIELRRFGGGPTRTVTAAISTARASIIISIPAERAVVSIIPG